MTVLAVALLLGCAAGFTQAESLKLERKPLGNARFDETLSPGCDCPRETASLSFKLHKRDRIDVAVVDEDGEVVRVLAAGLREDAGRVRFSWDGRDDEGQVVPDGVYRVRVRLLQKQRTVTIPEDVRVET